MVIVLGDGDQAILVLDSLSKGSQYQALCADAEIIYSFLASEWTKKHPSSPKKTFSSKTMPVRLIPSAQQNNDYDCGIFALANAETILSVVAAGQPITSIDFNVLPGSWSTSNRRNELTKVIEAFEFEERQRSLGIDPKETLLTGYTTFEMQSLDVDQKSHFLGIMNK